MKPFKRLIGAALLFGIACSHLSAQESAPQQSPLVIPNTDAWSIRTYDFISPGQMFVIYEKDGISVGALEVPKPDAGEAEVIAYIKKCTEIATESLKGEGIEIPTGTLCVFDPGNAGLTVRTNQRTHEFLACLASQYRYNIPKYAEFRLQIIEGEAGLMRAMVAKACQSADHTTLLTELENLAVEGKAKNVGNLSFSSRSGTRSSLTTNTEQQQLEAFTLKDRHLDNVEIATLPHGTSLEIDPVIEENLRYLGFTYALEHDYAPPISRWEPFRIADGQRIEARVADRHRLSSNSTISLADNTSRLIGIWPTEKLATGEAPTTLQAAFVRGRVISVSSLPEPHVAAWLKAYAEQIEPTPQISETTDPPHPGMEARFFSTSSGFMSPSNSEAGEASSSTAPFSENSSNHDPNSRKWRTAVKALTACGVEFPEGSGATYLDTF